MAKETCADPSKEDEQRWRAESDLRALVEVEEIKKDKPRYRRALALAKEQMSSLKKIGEA